MPDNKSCSLCAGRGCVASFFGGKKAQGKPLPSLVMCLLYGLPLIGLFFGAMLGLPYGENASIVGAGLGLVLSFMVLRACQRWLNRLCLQK